MTKKVSLPDGNQSTQVASDPFDPAALRLDQSYIETAAVKKLLTTVPVRKPNRQDFVRVQPDLDFRLSPAAIIELKEEREVYLVTPKVAADVAGEFVAVTLYTAINRQGVLIVWPVKLPGLDGKSNPWHQSATGAAERAMKRWIRLSANMNLGAYEIYEAMGNLPEPVWPDLSLQEILKVAFRDRIVDTADHPVIQRLRGAM